MQIMVRTRGFGRALGRAIGKVLGRKDVSDDDAPQRRRPIALARRQRQQQRVVKDPPTAAEELIDEQPEAPTEEVVTNVEGFPSGPHDTSILTDFENNIALRVWNGDECSELKLSSHGRKMAKFERPAPQIEGIVAVSGLSPLIAYSLDTGDWGLMSAFMECRHKETSSFHLPVREMTITLDVVASLLHLPIVRVFHSFKLLHVDDVVEMLVELLEVSAAECWIYDHFSSVGSAVPAENYDERSRVHVDGPLARHCPFPRIRGVWIDRPLMRWGLLTVIHRPERVVRQFGYIQTIPPHPAASSLSVEEINDRWMQFGEYIAPVGQLCAVSDHCSPDYMDWFYMISHPFMSSAQSGDPPRVPSIQQYEEFVEPDMYQQPMATVAPNEDDFVAIADKLDRLLNLRILIEGIEANTIVEECVSITRRYIGQPTVGHRLRRRRHTDGH
ncbi:Protein MAIN-LIKE 2 [Glycine soja]